jgi:hypothetical protein
MPLHQRFGRLAKLLFIAQHLPELIRGCFAGSSDPREPLVVIVRVVGLPQRK